MFINSLIWGIIEHGQILYLQIGADLSHVFCTSGAATVIKTYGPDLIVHPYIPDSTDYEDQEVWPCMLTWH